MSESKKIGKCPFCSDHTEISAPVINDTVTLPEDERCPHKHCPGFKGAEVMQAELARVASLRANWKARTAGPAPSTEPTDFEAGFLGTEHQATKPRPSKK